MPDDKVKKVVRKRSYDESSALYDCERRLGSPDSNTEAACLLDSSTYRKHRAKERVKCGTATEDSPHSREIDANKRKPMLQSGIRESCGTSVVSMESPKVLSSEKPESLSTCTKLSYITPSSWTSPGASNTPSPSPPSRTIECAIRGVLFDSIIDIDANDIGNEKTQYWVAEDVLKMWREMEEKYAIRHDYLKRQRDISGKMRAILIDWMVDVHLKFKLIQEVLHLSVSIVDRFLSKSEISRKKLQLVGMCAMLIASKFEDVDPPEVGDFVHVSDYTYTQADVLKTEVIVLDALGFVVPAPSARRFLQRNLKALAACRYDNMKLVKCLARYCIELALVDEHMLVFANSERAAAATLLAARVLCRDMTWNKTMVYYSKYEERALGECVRHLVRLLQKDRLALRTKAKLTAIHRKFRTSEFGEISRLIESIDLSAAFSKQT